MKLLPLPQAPTRQQAMFFRSSRLGPAVFFLFSLATMGAIIYAYAVGGISFVLMLVLLFGSLIFPLISSNMLVRSFQATNWLLALGPDRLWIKYRSYLNSHFPPDDLQIIELRYDELESVGLIRRKEITPGSRNGTQVQYYRHLEFALRQPFGNELPEALLAERNTKGSPGRRTSSRSLDYPVQVKGENTIRMRVNGIRPGWKTALREIEKTGITLAPEKREIEDYTVLLEDKRQMEDQLIVLVEQGKTIAAVKLARRRYGMTLTEAKNFIDGLSSR